MPKEHFTLSPAQDYTPPAYPTRTAQPAGTLKKLPVRWAKNAAVIACLGALTLGALAGCATQPQGAPCDDGLHGIVDTVDPQGGQYAENGRRFDVEVRSHMGGSGAGPFYVAYLTEQEALGIIRNRLCEAGICFDAPVPDYVATLATPWSTEITARLSLFDEDTRQGIVFPIPWSWRTEFDWVDMPPNHIRRTLQQEFAQGFNISATFLSNPREPMCDGNFWERERDEELTFTNEEKQEAGQILKERLSAQVDTFIDQLRAEGILPAEHGNTRANTIPASRP